MKKLIIGIIGIIIGIILTISINYVGASISSNGILYNDKALNVVLDDLYKKVEEDSCEMIEMSFDYDYIGSEKIFTVPMTGTYKLEVWGAQGGSVNTTYIGGYGGYSTGTIKLTKGDYLYINVGGNNGYNGGGNGSETVNNGGGATHIATKSGLLYTLSSSKSNILIVAGGGGGSVYYPNTSNASGSGGDAGGYTGSNGRYTGWTTNSGLGGTQTSGGSYGKCSDGGICGVVGSFGKGGEIYICNSVNCSTTYQAGGGGGFYGGGSARHAGGGGGSGYIGNSLLTNKVMYCYNCAKSSATSTKTISTTNVSETPTSNYAKKGNGFARITLVST